MSKVLESSLVHTLSVLSAGGVKQMVTVGRTLSMLSATTMMGLRRTFANRNTWNSSSDS